MLRAVEVLVRCEMDCSGLWSGVAKSFLELLDRHITQRLHITTSLLQLTEQCQAPLLCLARDAPALVLSADVLNGCPPCRASAEACAALFARYALAISASVSVFVFPPAKKNLLRNSQKRKHGAAFFNLPL